MFRKVIGCIVLLSFLLVNVVALSAPTFVKEVAEHAMPKSTEKAEKNTDEEELKVSELDEFLNPPILLLTDLNNNGAKRYIYNFDSILNIHISLPYPPPNPLA